VADPQATLAKFQTGEPVSHQEIEEATLYVLILQQTELEHLCNRLGMLLNAQGVEVPIAGGEPPGPNGGSEPIPRVEP
jgi:hypothetical protein